MPCSTPLFAKYLNPVFIETGSFTGDGIQAAIDAGFQKIISIELSQHFFEVCTNRFRHNPNVQIIHGDSFKVLPDIIKNIDNRITFWLDGHYSCGNTAKGEYWAPLIQELEVIKNHHVKTHTVMIDDMRCWQEPNETHGFYVPDILNKLNEINDQYELVYEYGVEKDDVLVAYIPDYKIIKVIPDVQRKTIINKFTKAISSIRLFKFNN
jgi:hypothetical protein